MRIRIPVSIAAAIGAAALLAACSGGTSTPTGSSLPTTSQSVVSVHNYSPQKSLSVPFALAHLPGQDVKPTFPGMQFNATVVVGECGYYGSDCNLYSNGSVVATLSSGNGMTNPQGTIVDAATGDWVIANTGASNVPYYDVSGSTLTLDTTYSDSGQYPVDVATIDKGKKLLCTVISNIFTTGGSPGSVTTVCGKKSSNFTASGAYQGIGVATDSKGNCYWSFNLSSGGGDIVEFKKCKGKSTTLVTGLGFAGGVAFDKANNMYYSDQLAGVYACKGTKSCALAFSGFTDGLMINFSSDFKTLFVADAGAGNIDACAIGGSCSTYASRSTSDPPFGVAPDPGIY